MDLIKRSHEIINLFHAQWACRHVASLDRTESARARAKADGKNDKFDDKNDKSDDEYDNFDDENDNFLRTKTKMISFSR